MKLGNLIHNGCPEAVLDTLNHNEMDLEITDLSTDSRQLSDSTLFIASAGAGIDGHRFMQHALENGAAAILAQANPDRLPKVILVDNTQIACAALADYFFGSPSRELTLIGVTGTNGKTTVTWLIESILKTAGHPCGVIGTVNSRFGDTVIETGYTTPDAILLQKTLKKMKDSGITHVVMEVSSHGLDLHRVDKCSFDTAVFTNLTRDHLDFHDGMDQYFDCKKRLFTEFLGSHSKNDAPAVINIDTAKGRQLKDALTCRTISVGKQAAADVRADDVNNDIHGLSGNLFIGNLEYAFTSILTGAFNLENILCAAGATHAIGIAADAIVQGIASCKIVPGRLEKIENSIDRHLFVDYAHTPDALASVLGTLSQNAPGKIITVFGCGGNRDRAKRPLMGQAVCQASDIAIVTSDNPRSEPPETIISDVVQGLGRYRKLDLETAHHHPQEKGYLVIADRTQAIHTALNISKAGDIVLVAGKGHETYQILADRTIHFDDREHIRAAVQEITAQRQPQPWTLDDLSQALGVHPCFCSTADQPVFSSISTDSRTTGQDQIFIALKGDRFDAHDFIPQLIKKGIGCFVVENGFIDGMDQNLLNNPEPEPLVIYEVPSSLSALGDMARFHRLRNKAKVIGLTGSSGKTTTRKILESIFQTRFHTLATKGNLNNEIGVPLTLLNLSPLHEWAIIEMGMNHAGEMSRLSQMAVPDIAMVINTAGAHLEGLGTVENVARAKAEIFEGVRAGGAALLPADDPRIHILESAARKNPDIRLVQHFGQHPEADIMLSGTKHIDGQSFFTVCADQQEKRYSIPSPAKFMIQNCLGAICAARTAGIDPDDIQKGLSRFSPAPGRLNVLSLNGHGHLIDDTYNANPDSMEQALETLAFLGSSGITVAVLGDMLELGETSASLHQDIGKKVVKLGISTLYLHGEMAWNIQTGALAEGMPREKIFLGEKKEITARLADQLTNNTWVLIKGSRGMTMESIIRDLRQTLTKTA